MRGGMAVSILPGGLALNPAAAGNGAMNFLFHIRRARPALPGNTVVKIDITGRGRIQLDAAGTRGGFNPLFRRRGAGGWVARLAGLVPGFFGSTPGFLGSAPRFSGSTPAFRGHTLAFSGSAPGFSEYTPAFSGSTPAFSGSTPAFSGSAFLQKVSLFGRKMADLGRFLMRPAFYGSGLRYGDPNVRWGSPGYVLEPGDPGYVPPIPSVNEPKTKEKRMKHKEYYPKRQADQIVWLANFISKLAGYATALSLQPAAVTAALADAGWLKYILELWLPASRAWQKSCTDALKSAESESGSSALTLPTFTAPPLPTGVTAQAPGSLKRIFALVASIKKDGKLTSGIADDLRIVGSEDSGPDFATLQPVLTAKVASNGVELGWNFQGFREWLSNCEFVVDRGDGKGFRHLVTDSTPNYTDTETYPTAKAIWTYKAVFFVDDRSVGQWSQPVSVTVGG
jgi:hypothetical protein